MEPHIGANRRIALSEKKLHNYVGQERIKDITRIHVNHHLRMGGGVPHTILFGNPGLGKTTFAQVMADAVNTKIEFYTGGGIGSVKVARKIIHSIEPGVFIFIDETHALPRKVEEEFYSPMQDFYSTSDEGRFVIPNFTLVGATTSAGMLSKPFLDRFRLHLNMDAYSVTELAEIVHRKYKLERITCLKIASRSMGVPRIALGLADTIRKAGNEANKVFDLLKIDKLGLQSNHRLVLSYLIEMNRPVGVQSVSYGCDISQHDLVNIYERDLLKLGLMARTPRGRMITPKGITYMRGQ